jgi:bacteriochlorophyll 4-vinyl reductase
MSSREDYVVINSIMLQALVAAEQVMGANGMSAVLHASGLDHFISNYPPNNLEPAIRASEYSRFLHAIEEFYGRASKGMLRRIGKASFQYGVREQPALMGVTGLVLKLLPEKQRIKLVLNGMIGALKKINPEAEIWLDEQGDAIGYVAKTCGVCWGRESDQPVCHMYVGTVSEAVIYATGVEHEVVETHCQAKGDEVCRFEIGAPKA